MPFIVQTSSAKMPNSVRSPYRRVAVIQVEPGIAKVAMISDRARGVVRIVQKWERLHARGVNTAYARALVEANDLAVKLNTYEVNTRNDLDRDPVERATP